MRAHCESRDPRNPSRCSSANFPAFRGDFAMRSMLAPKFIDFALGFAFDEPLSNLYAKLRIDMRTKIKELHSAPGTTIVYVTHQIEAMMLATGIAVMKDGLVQQKND